MALIPVVLEFSGVARDSSLNLTLATDGVSWSIGDADVHTSEGFSYNALAWTETRPSCLTSIEFTESVLAIRTSPNAAGSSFSLTLFIDVPSDVESVQGHCTLNADARVISYFGYDVGAEWRSGPFSAIVPRMPEDTRRIRVSIRSAPVGSAITLELMTERSEGEAYWCLDSGTSGASGLILRGAAGLPLPVRMFTITDRQIVVIPGGTQKIAGDLFIEVYLRRAVVQGSTEPTAKKLKRFHLQVQCDRNAAVSIQVGAQRPQALAATYSCFYF